MEWVGIKGDRSEKWTVEGKKKKKILNVCIYNLSQSKFPGKQIQLRR
jgi:hypothetical protein